MVGPWLRGLPVGPAATSAGAGVPVPVGGVRIQRDGRTLVGGVAGRPRGYIGGVRRRGNGGRLTAHEETRIADQAVVMGAPVDSSPVYIQGTDGGELGVDGG